MKFLFLLLLLPILVFSCTTQEISSCHHCTIGSILALQHYTHTHANLHTSYFLCCCCVICHPFSFASFALNPAILHDHLSSFQLFLFICLCCSFCRFGHEVLLEVDCIWGLPVLLLHLHCAVCSGHLSAAELLCVCGDVGFPSRHVRSHSGPPTVAAKLPKSHHQRHEVMYSLMSRRTFH